MNKKGIIIGFSGFISSGKDTAADYLVNFHEFRRESFANTLKDALSAVFGWDRILMEGRTKEAREWREQVDTWWAARLGIPHFTPRWAMQHIGTNVLRESFHDDIWIASLENKLRKTQDNIVISDVRFPNEIKAIQRAGGLVVRIKRGPEPLWYNAAITANHSAIPEQKQKAQEELNRLGVHASESSWVGYKFDWLILNDSTVDELFNQLKNLLLDRPYATVDLIDAEFSDNLHTQSLSL